MCTRGVWGANLGHTGAGRERTAGHNALAVPLAVDGARADCLGRAGCLPRVHGAAGHYGGLPDCLRGPLCTDKYIAYVHCLQCRQVQVSLGLF